LLAFDKFPIHIINTHSVQMSFNSY